MQTCLISKHQSGLMSSAEIKRALIMAGTEEIMVLLRVQQDERFPFESQD